MDEYEPSAAASLSVDADEHQVTVRFDAPSSDEIASAIALRMWRDYSSSKALQAAALERFNDLVRQSIDDAAKAAIADALVAPRVQTDEFGNPISAPVTFAQMIAIQVRGWQEETVDPYNGNRKDKSTYGSSTITRAEYLVRQVGAEEFGKLAREEVAKIKADAKARLGATIATSVRDAVATIVKAA